MKPRLRVIQIVLRVSWLRSRVFFVTAAAVAGSSVNVTQHHNNPSRDGLYIDPAFTTAAAANLTR